MKGKKITSLMCAGALLFGFAAAPISTAQAYTVSDRQRGDPAYEMPLEVKARYDEGRNHYFDIQAYLTDSGLDTDKMLSDEFEHDLIMPGDTFEIPIYITEGHTVFYMGAANGGDDTTVPNYNSITTDYLSSEYFYKGYEYSGDVTPIKIVTKTFGTGADSRSGEWRCFANS
ncbi:MAG: hypothetical protein IIY78_00130 [Clostridia bacterium]|nr:hypothetical protein [Clostridia bacterium]